MRRELDDRDKQLYERKKSTGKHYYNKNIEPYQSHYNLIAEVDQKNSQYLQNLNQKRQSIFNMATNIDDFETMKNYGKKRRFSSKIKDFFVSNINLNSSNMTSTAAYTNSTLNLAAKIAPAEQEILKS
jgi:hypothetical protein